MPPLPRIGRRAVLAMMLIVAVAVALNFADAEGCAAAQPPDTDNDLMLFGCQAAEEMMADNKMPSSPESLFTAGLCIGHINTALYYLQNLSPETPSKDDTFCVPRNVTVVQFLGVLNKYMRQHPERRNEPFNRAFRMRMRPKGRNWLAA